MPKEQTQFGKGQDPRVAQQKGADAKHEKRLLRERLRILATGKIKNRNGEEAEREDVISLQLINKAIAGDLKAIRLYAELTGQLTQEIKVDTQQPLQIYEWEKRKK